MARHRILKNEKLSAGSSGNKDFPPIPSKKTLKLRSFGAADINMGDNKSSVWVLQWGAIGNFETIRVLSLTGFTKEILFKRELIGDGVKFLRVKCINNSGFEKDLPFWVEGILG